jgi:predicted Zn-dependent protease with MMP-like domain
MITIETFEKMVAEGIDAIPREFLDKLENVAMVIEEEPTGEQRRKMKLRSDTTLLGLYEGIPQSARGANYSAVLPDKITIFRKPILEAARDEAGVRTIVRDTVWHVGMDEGRVQGAEMARRKRRA